MLPWRRTVTLGQVPATSRYVVKFYRVRLNSVNSIDRIMYSGGELDVFGRRKHSDTVGLPRLFVCLPGPPTPSEDILFVTGLFIPFLFGRVDVDWSIDQTKNSTRLQLVDVNVNIKLQLENTLFGIYLTVVSFRMKGNVRSASFRYRYTS